MSDNNHRVLAAVLIKKTVTVDEVRAAIEETCPEYTELNKDILFAQVANVLTEVAGPERTHIKVGTN